VNKKNDFESVAPFETPTLAAIFVHQGHLKKGLEIYRKLHRFDPGNHYYQEKINELMIRIEKEGSVVDADAKTLGVADSASMSGKIERRKKEPLEGQNRVLETLNKWLAAARKRKKHV
jgi:hypothetical protein